MKKSCLFIIMGLIGLTITQPAQAGWFGFVSESRLVAAQNETKLAQAIASARAEEIGRLTRQLTDMTWIGYAGTTGALVIAVMLVWYLWPEAKRRRIEKTKKPTEP